MKRKKELLGQFQIKPLKIVKYNGVKNVYRSTGDAEHNQINIMASHIGQKVAGHYVGGDVSGDVGGSVVSDIMTGANSGYIGDSGTFTNSVYATKTARTDAIEPNNDTFGTVATEIGDQGMVRKFQSRLHTDTKLVIINYVTYCYYVELMKCELNCY